MCVMLHGTVPYHRERTLLCRCGNEVPMVLFSSSSATEVRFMVASPIPW